MEQGQIESANEEKKLAEFRAKIAHIAADEKINGETANFQHQVDFHSEELTKEDMHIWERTQEGAVTEGEFQEYRATFKAQGGYEKSPSRVGFISLVGNQASAIIGERWLEQQRKKQT